jgi:hypothetical protein
MWRSTPRTHHLHQIAASWGRRTEQEERPMAQFTVGIETTATPEKVREALTDFTDRRTEIWPGLSKQHYAVYEVGDTTAVIREGSDKPSVWARERYDWSKPGVVRWEVLESNFCNPGSYVQATATPGADDGSHVEIEWSRTGSNAFGKVVVVMMKVVGPRIIKGYIKKSLDAYAATTNEARAA